MQAFVSALARYPVKSCRGHALDAALVEPWGLAGDRRWMLVDPQGTFLSARTRPRMVLVVPEPDAGGGLVLRAPGVDPIAVRQPVGGELVDVEVWRDRLKATLADDAAHEWFSAVLGEPVRLVHLDDPARRPTDPEFSRPDDRVSFADGFPLLLTAEASLAALDELVAQGRYGAEGPLSMTRFRPNVVISGTTAWEEEGLGSLRIGEAAFRAPKPCGRCVITTVDPDTASRGREPLASLAAHRRRGRLIPFGINLIPDTPGAIIRVGDPVSAG